MPLRSGKLGSADYYLIRLKPGGAHKRFRILKQTKLPTGKVVSETVPDPRLDAINAALLAGGSLAAADKAVLDLLKRLYRDRDHAKPIATYHADNVAVFESFWTKHYAKNGKAQAMKAPKNARAAFVRVLRALGNLNLLTASEPELRKSLEVEVGLRAAGTLTRERERQAKLAYSRLSGRLNQILAGVGRDMELARGSVPRPVVRFITHPDLALLLGAIPDADVRLLVTVAFGTGMRCGECFAYDPEDVQQGGRRIWVEEQLKYLTVAEAEATGRPRFYRDELKNRREHHTFVLPFARPAVAAWLEVSTERREVLRVARLAETLEDAAKRLWPDQPLKHVGFHDLRHSYSIHCLNVLGLNLTTVAGFLGDNYQTVERYYKSWVMSDEAIDRCETIAQALEPKAKAVDS